MIKAEKLNKNFDGFQALSNFNINIKKGSIYGLVGTNGAGKTTIIKHLTGILRGDSGSVTIEDEPVYNNLSIKERIGYIPDDLSYLAPYTLKDFAGFVKELYPKWDANRFSKMAVDFALDTEKKISTFSKGMQKQAAFVIAMSQKPDYLILDEPIDGLDPLIRKLVWQYVIDDVAEREMTVLISSHNLREMEGFCDCVGIITKGTMVIERDLDILKSDVHKLQVAFNEAPLTDPYDGLNILHKETRGSVDLLIVRNKKEQVEFIIHKSKPAVFDMLPLTLEEIFIYELGGNSDENILL